MFTHSNAAPMMTSKKQSRYWIDWSYTSYLPTVLPGLLPYDPLTCVRICLFWAQKVRWHGSRRVWKSLWDLYPCLESDLGAAGSETLTQRHEVLLQSIYPDFHRSLYSERILLLAFKMQDDTGNSELDRWESEQIELSADPLWISMSSCISVGWITSNV